MFAQNPSTFHLTPRNARRWGADGITKSKKKETSRFTNVAIKNPVPERHLGCAMHTSKQYP